MRALPLLAVLALLVAPVGFAGGAPFDLVAVRGVPPVGLDRFGAEGQPAPPLPAGSYFFEAAFPGTCHGETTTVDLQPVLGWSGPIFVVRNYATQPVLLDYTGHASGVALAAVCQGDLLRTKDLLVLPLGQLSFLLVASVTLEVDGRVYHDEDVFGA